MPSMCVHVSSQDNDPSPALPTSEDTRLKLTAPNVLDTQCLPVLRHV